MGIRNRAFTAKVISTKDPEGLGRVKVSLPGYSKEPGRKEEGEWVRVNGMAAGSNMGMVWLPEDGQEVVVAPMSAGGELMMTGSVFNGEEKPPYSNEDGNNEKKMLRTRSGHEVIFSDKDGSEAIEVRTPNAQIQILLENAGPKITILCEDKIHVEAKGDISLKAKNITAEAENVTVKASKNAFVEGSSHVTVKGGRIDLKN